MNRNSDFAIKYREQIDTYIRKGYARELSDEEAQRRTGRTWYLPHFAAINANKPGKFRMVFDAAAKVRGVALNSMLLAGPDINIPLTRILHQFRMSAVGVCADIQEMFHQVRIRSEDTDSQRFLWRDGDAKVKPRFFVMDVMTFGATCSPTSAQYVKNVNADEFASELPEAADAIRRSHYVDDFVASFETPETAARITADVVEIHRRGGFVLRGIVTNSEEVRNNLGIIKEQNQQKSLELDDTIQKILGMSWDTSDDTFRFKTCFARVHPDVVNGSRRPSKREVLSVAMSIFDPFGLLANFTLMAKTIIQDLWRIGLGWDEAIPEEVDQRWQAWRAQIERTKLTRIPRCYSTNIKQNK